MIRKTLPMMVVLGALIFGYQNCGKYPYQTKHIQENQTLETKHFYLIEENFKCQNLMGDTVETYKDSLYFFDGNVCFTGNGCTDQVLCVPWPQDLEVAMDRSHVTYKGEVYYLMNTPPFETN